MFPAFCYFVNHVHDFVWHRAGDDVGIDIRAGWIALVLSRPSWDINKIRGAVEVNARRLRFLGMPWETEFIPFLRNPT